MKNQEQQNDLEDRNVSETIFRFGFRDNVVRYFHYFIEIDFQLIEIRVWSWFRRNQ